MGSVCKAGRRKCPWRGKTSYSSMQGEVKDEEDINGYGAVL